MFSLVSQEVMVQPPTDGPASANKKKQSDIRDMTGSFGKVMVRAMVSQVYTLTLKPQTPHHGHRI